MVKVKMSPSFKHLTDTKYGAPDVPPIHNVLQIPKPHIDSFNYMLHKGLSYAVKRIRPIEFSLPSGDRICLQYTDASVFSPVVASGNTYATSLKVYPAECRERRISYKGRLSVSLVCTVNGHVIDHMKCNVGEIPIMLKSSACNLHKLSPKELIQKGEEAQEMGGYFIIDGIERVIRMVIMSRRNYPLCVKRVSWKSRGQLYTEYGIVMRCVTPALAISNMTLHYLNNGTVTVAFSYRKELFFVPLMFVMKALLPVNDYKIYSHLIAGREDDSFFKGCICQMLRTVLNEELYTQTSVLDYFGKHFRVRFYLPEWYTDEDVGNFIIRNCICVHLSSNVDKFNTLIHMTQKLFAFSRGQCAAENPDSIMNHEVLLPGHLYLMVLREKMENWLLSLRSMILTQLQKKENVDSLTADIFHSCVDRMKDPLTRAMEYLIATGNVKTHTGLGLSQISGFSVVADKLNILRFISHFRCIHRGSFFTEMRTTDARKLLPEYWGFVCPVQTPDGVPCGLLNHLSAHCQVVNSEYDNADLFSTLISMGVTPPFENTALSVLPDCYIVLLDGNLVGHIPDSLVFQLTQKLRAMKVHGSEKVPSSVEICLIPKTNQPTQYPGLYIFTSLARMVRPVYNLEHQKTEVIGTFEQVYLDIAITTEELIPEVTTHLELDEAGILSIVAGLTPFSDFNQSPRNMYQCQMAKQTMGTPCHAISKRADNKLYRLQTPQSPLVRPTVYESYAIDDYPLGTNTIVAVISYTAYDMEDAMVINKASYERGFAHGCVYRSEVVNLKDKRNKMSDSTFIFRKGPSEDCPNLDIDGLPYIGTFLDEGDPFYSIMDINTGEVKVTRYKHEEGAYVDQIKILGNDKGNELFTKVCFLLRIPRNPIIGDKFASRHGQKGICSQKWPVENMPFTESGITPDVLFNPHGYPSRMTIGMMVESMAGKCAALNGVCHDATPFKFSEDDPAIDHFAKILSQNGYDYYGREQMYSGIDGRHFEADIFMGVVYYQRLRHMVSDKFQVRTTGPIDNLTHQPVQGRKRHGGIRFGEMERDALIAHGAAYVLQDRLFNCSDKSLARVCTTCKSMISPTIRPRSHDSDLQHRWTCPICKDQSHIELIAVPYVFKLLAAELASINITLEIDIK